MSMRGWVRDLVESEPYSLGFGAAERGRFLSRVADLATNSEVLQHLSDELADRFLWRLQQGLHFAAWDSRIDADLRVRAVRATEPILTTLGGRERELPGLFQFWHALLVSPERPHDPDPVSSEMVRVIQLLLHAESPQAVLCALHGVGHSGDASLRREAESLSELHPAEAVREYAMEVATGGTL
ncbi:MAG: hypothetical protein IT303_00605 [Dehalococcoidia bacterium]|nr:hypothetical protein [Dehalococcoidia bacterium]